MRRLKRVGTVVFDCDSTLSALEGIDELAAGASAEVEALTNAAMAGTVPLQAVYGRRMELVRPSRARLEWLAERYVETAVEDAREVVAALRAEGIEVRIISGGLLPAVAGFAAWLGLRESSVAAVDVRFDAAGEYAGYDAASPLTRTGGKREVLRLWRREAPPPIMLVGDGATDLEAQPDVDVFVAFAGVVARPEVVNAAEWVVRGASLAPILALALGGAPPRVSAARPLFELGLAMLDRDSRFWLEYTPTPGLDDA
jgi:phosphoserine phosphatase